MSDFPEYVTPEQQMAAARALGIDPSHVTHFQVDAVDGVTVVELVRNDQGRPTAVASGLIRNIPIRRDAEQP